jgi:regulator of nucleoside diphosphate kinase
MKKKTIQITNYDMERLQELLSNTKYIIEKDEKVLHKLEGKLKRAEIVFWKDIFHNVVTMNSQVRLREYDTKEEMVLDVVFPDEANPKWNHISVLTSLGTALIGRSVGDNIKWNPSADTTEQIEILEILFQPEANKMLNK